MNKLNIRAGIAQVVEAAKVGVKVAKVAAIVAVMVTSLVGGYVLSQVEVRNFVINYAQNEAPINASSPKE